MSLQQLDKYLIEYIASMLDLDSLINFNRTLAPELRTMTRRIVNMNILKKFALAHLADIYRNFELDDEFSFMPGKWNRILTTISEMPYLENLKNSSFGKMWSRKMSAIEIKLADPAVQYDAAHVAACLSAIAITRKRLTF